MATKTGWVPYRLELRTPFAAGIPRRIVRLAELKYQTAALAAPAARSLHPPDRLRQADWEAVRAETFECYLLPELPQPVVRQAERLVEQPAVRQCLAAWREARRHSSRQEPKQQADLAVDWPPAQQAQLALRVQAVLTRLWQQLPEIPRATRRWREAPQQLAPAVLLLVPGALPLPILHLPVAALWSAVLFAADSR